MPKNLIQSDRPITSLLNNSNRERKRPVLGRFKPVARAERLLLFVIGLNFSHGKVLLASENPDYCVIALRWQDVDWGRNRFMVRSSKTEHHEGKESRLVPLLSGLNEPQRQAVVCVEGPLLVLAGPGSGKTRVITHRIAWMLEHGIRPYNIVALTFTNKAADEMKKRLEVLAPDKPIRIGTFHKFCAYLLRLYAPMVGLEPNFTIYDTDESKKPLDLILERVTLPTGITPDRIAAGISWAKNELVLPEEYISRTGSQHFSMVTIFWPRNLRVA